MTEAAVSSLRNRWAGALAWSAVVAGSLLLTALAAPLVFAALQGLVAEFRYPPSRVFNRVAMVFAVLLLVLLRRELGWPELWRLLGRGSVPQRGAEVAVGMTVSLAAVGLGILWAFAVGQLGPTLNPYSFFAMRTAEAFVGGIVVALMEESFFRGLMLSSLARGLGWRAAAVLSSMVYSLVHLLVPDRSVTWEGYSWDAGLGYLVHVLDRQVEPAALPPLFGLFIAGMVLAWVVRATGSLMLAVGLHAGWAFAFPVVRHATRVLVDIPGTSLLAGQHYVVGTTWAWSSLVLAGVVVVVWARLRERRGRR